MSQKRLWRKRFRGSDWKRRPKPAPGARVRGGHRDVILRGQRPHVNNKRRFLATFWRLPKSCPLAAGQRKLLICERRTNRRAPPSPQPSPASGRGEHQKRFGRGPCNPPSSASRPPSFGFTCVADLDQRLQIFRAQRADFRPEFVRFLRRYQWPFQCPSRRIIQPGTATDPANSGRSSMPRSFCPGPLQPAVALRVVRPIDQSVDARIAQRMHFHAGIELVSGPANVAQRGIVSGLTRRFRRRRRLRTRGQCAPLQNIQIYISSVFVVRANLNVRRIAI